MPLPEFYRMGKGKIEAPQQRSTPSSTDLSFIGDNELVELIWDNGQIMMQGQSNKGRKIPLSSTTSKIGKFGTTESIFNDFGVSDDMVLSHEDEMVRWLNYPVDDNLQLDYYSEILPELSGVTVNEPSTRNNFTLLDKRDRFNQMVRDSSSFGSGISDPFSSNTSTRHHHGHVSLAGFPHMKMQKQGYGVPTSNSNLLNFSHFSRPATNARANLENIVALPDSGLLRMGDKDKGSATSVSRPPKFTPIDSNNRLQEEMSLTMPDEEPLPSQQSGAVCRENDIGNNNSLDHDLSMTKGALESEKVVEPVVASSSVCSANSVERTSNDLTYNLKRKSRDSEESEWRSEDIEEESVGVKKVACARGGTSSKRSRAAEVHNLSERRRRDRINEKMRALQELIPNCNKVDKASMLDEAIEYLKTLQLQVQMMSMGAGLYMPPMMLPTGMQHIHGTHLPHFSMGMGMRMGYGIGMQGAHFHPPQHISGPASFQGLAGSDLRVFGYPAQGLPVSGSVPLPARPPINSGTGLNASRTGTCVEVLNASPSLNPNDLVEHTNTQVMQNAGASSSMPETSTQKNDQGPEVGSSADVKSTNANVSVSITAAGND